VNFSCFAPATVQNNGEEFSLDISAFVAAQVDAVVQAAQKRGKVEKSSFPRTQIRLTAGVEVTVTLGLPDEAFGVERAEGRQSFEWNGSNGNAQFAVECLRRAEPRVHTCRAFIDVNGQRKILIFDLEVVSTSQLSPPGTPPSERSCELQSLEFELSPGKQYHFFICHHQGSGGDQANLLCLELRKLGYFVWYDYGVVATKRNLPGMKEGVTKSECLLIFLSGRKEVVQDGEGVANPAGKYEGTFTRWFCHEEMRTAHEQELRFVGVMETELRHCKPDFALEKSQALTGGSDGGPVNTNAPDHVYLLSGLCFIPFRRQEHEVVAMLKEIERQAALPGGGLGLEPEPEEFGDFDCFPGDDLTDFGDFGGGADPFDSDPFADFHPFDESTPAPAPAVAELASTADGFFEEDPFRAAPAPARSVAAPAAVATAPTGRGMFDFGAPVAASPPPQQQAAMEPPRGPHHGMVQPQQGMMQPQHAMMQPQQGMMQPQQGMTQPHHGMMQPHHGMMQPQGMMQLQHAMMQPQQAMQPQHMMMQPQQAMMQPQPGTMQPQGIMQPLHMAISSQHGGMQQRSSSNPFDDYW
jgi:hypothetical protein